MVVFKGNHPYAPARIWALQAEHLNEIPEPVPAPITFGSNQGCGVPANVPHTGSDTNGVASIRVQITMVVDSLGQAVQIGNQNSQSCVAGEG